METVRALLLDTQNISLGEKPVGLMQENKSVFNEVAQESLNKALAHLKKSNATNVECIIKKGGVTIKFLANTDPAVASDTKEYFPMVTEAFKNCMSKKPVLQDETNKKAMKNLNKKDKILAKIHLDLDKIVEQLEKDKNSFVESKCRVEQNNVSIRLLTYRLEKSIETEKAQLVDNKFEIGKRLNGSFIEISNLCDRTRKDVKNMETLCTEANARSSKLIKLVVALNEYEDSDKELLSIDKPKIDRLVEDNRKTAIVFETDSKRPAQEYGKARTAFDKLSADFRNFKEKASSDTFKTAGIKVL